MFDRDKWQEILNTIRKHKLRTVLTALGVWWGIFMLIFLMGAGQGLQNGVTGEFGDHATNALYVWTQRTIKPYDGLPAGRYPQLTSEDIEAIRTSLPGIVEYIAPRLFVNTGEITRGTESASFDVRGELPDLIHIEAIRIQRGRFINQLDIDAFRKTAVIGDRVREVLFGEDDPLGEYIRFNGAEYQVVGIFESSRRGGDNASQDEELVFIPLSTAQRVANRPRDINWFVCTISTEFEVEKVEEAVKDVIRERHHIHPEDNQGVNSHNVAEEFRNIMGLFFGIKLLIWIVGIGSLLAGVIGVGNIMLIVVKERTQEIGVRKALGATPGSIISMVLMESVVITTAAGYLGLLSSTGIIFLVGQVVGEGGQFFSNPQVNLGVGFGALLILVFAGALTGLLPALHASRIHPVEALRNE